MSHPKGFFVRHFGLRGVALFEAFKGILAVAGGIWVLTLRHKDLERVAEHMLRMFHIAPDRHVARGLLHLAEKINGRDLRIVLLFVVIYAAIRFVEAAGLWLEKEWAEWFALISGTIYVPLEIIELVRRPTPLKWGVLIINVLIVLYMAWLLQDSYKRRRLARETTLPAD